jgi:hypothetical protein
MNVYNPSAFRDRINYAAGHISRGRPTNRVFCACFEMCDGDEVATALFRRAQARPNTKLAHNLWRYLCRESVERTAARLAHVPTSQLADHAASSRACFAV